MKNLRTTHPCDMTETTRNNSYAERTRSPIPGSTKWSIRSNDETISIQELRGSLFFQIVDKVNIRKILKLSFTELEFNAIIL